MVHVPVQVKNQASVSNTLRWRPKVLQSMCTCVILPIGQMIVVFFSRAVNAQQIDTYQLKSLDGQFGKGITTCDKG